MNYLPRRLAFSTAFFGGVVAACLLPAGALYAQNCSRLLAAPISFGDIDGDNWGASIDNINNNNTVGSLTYQCSHASTVGSKSMTVCLGIGLTDFRHLVRPGGETLKYNIYKDSNRGEAWGTIEEGKAMRVSFDLGPTQTMPLTIPLYGRISSGQTRPPSGLYSMSYARAEVILKYASQNLGSSPLPCTSLTHTLSTTLLVTANLLPSCTVEASPIQVGGSRVPSQAINQNGSGEIRVECDAGTSYIVGLIPSNSNLEGKGEMKQADLNNNATIEYQLRQQSASGPVWGNTGTIANPLNSVSGTGDGLKQTIPVFVTVPTVNVPAGIYSDLVTVRVTY